MLSKSIRIEDYSVNESSFLLEFDEFYDYDFPREDTVPAGNYHGLIVHAHPGETLSHNPCLDVYFQLLDNIELQRWKNEIIDEVVYHRVKFRFKKDSEPYRKFLSCMFKKGLPKKSKPEQLVDYTCSFKLVYHDHCSLGAIDLYYDCTPDQGCFELNET